MNEILSIFMAVVKDNFANFNGRARRKEYWMFQLAVIIVFIVLGILATILSFISTTLGSLIFGLMGIAILAIVIPSIALTVRRMHDVDKSGRFMFIPLYNLILSLTEGTHGDNQYGPDPKA